MGFGPPGQVSRKFEVAGPRRKHTKMEVLTSVDSYAQLA
jgi:hypothetical protein